MFRRLLCLTLLVALIPVAAGCGSDKKKSGGSATTASTATQGTTSSAAKTAYQAEVRTILTSVGSAGSALGTAAKSSKSATDIAAALENFQASVTKAADALPKLTPPNASAKTGQDELEQVLREIAQGVQPSIQAAKGGDRAKFVVRFRAYQAKLASDYRGRLTAAGAKIDQALAGQ
jgi:hypothetical protein